MKRINNKGFAISTMLYGLLIIIVLIVAMILSIMAFNRKTNKEFTETIIDGLEKKEVQEPEPEPTPPDTPQPDIPTTWDNYNKNIVEAYALDGQVTTCYKNNPDEACEVGTKIKYNVNGNNGETEKFYIIGNEGNKYTLLLDTFNSNISLYTISWEQAPTYVSRTTESWSNVNELTYTSINCSNYPSVFGCYKNLTITARARMMTLSEAETLGCTENYFSCPEWIKSSFWLSDYKEYSQYGTGTLIGGLSVKGGRIAGNSYDETYVPSIVVEISKFDT